MFQVRTFNFGVFLIYILSIAASIFIVSHKYRALAFDEKDFPFYFQFASKAMDANLLEKSYSLNPEGYNFIGLAGTEGTDSLHQTIHFEPIKYIWSMIYKVFPGPISLFLFTAILFYLPFLYLTILMPQEQELNKPFVLLLVIVQAIYPSTLFAVGYDLRPYILLGPFIALAIYAIHFHRSNYEILFFFNLLFLAREEALIFGLIMILYTWLRKKSPEKNSLIFSMLLVWFGWLIITCSFFLWAGYPLGDKGINRLVHFLLKHNLILELMAILGMLLIAVFMYYRSKILDHINRTSHTIEISVFLLVGLPLITPVAELFWDRLAVSGVLNGIVSFTLDIFLDPRYNLYLSIFTTLLILIWNVNLSVFHRRSILATLAVIGFLSVIVNVSSPLAAPALIKQYISKQQYTKALFQLEASTDPYQNHILTDYSTYQAYSGYQYVYVYNRLPWSLAPGRERYFPDNLSYLEKIVRDKIEYIAITRESEKDLIPLLAKWNIQTQVVSVNNLYVVLKIVK